MVKKIQDIKNNKKLIKKNKYQFKLLNIENFFLGSIQTNLSLQQTDSSKQQITSYCFNWE